MKDFNEFLTHDARLVILRALTEQSDGRLRKPALACSRRLCPPRQPGWIRQQLRHLADLGAVKITEVGAIMIAAITRLGADHVAPNSNAKRPTIGA